jgi:putative flippase GtrA
VLDWLSNWPTSDFYLSIRHLAFTATTSPIFDFIASMAAFGVAVLWNFAWNSLWTFRTSADHRHNTVRRLGLYVGFSLGALAVNEAVLFAAGFFMSPLFGQVIGSLVGSVAGFAGNYRYTFAEGESRSYARQG